MQSRGWLAAAWLMLACSTGRAEWGVRYEVNDGTGWTTALSLNLSRESQTLDFRITVFLGGSTPVQTSTGPATAIGPQRLCNSQRISNFGSAGSGDSLLSFVRTVPNGNAAGLVSSQSGSDKILGTPNSSLSFAADLNYGTTVPRVPLAEMRFYSGTLKIGNATAGARERVITLSANTFGYPNPTIVAGGANGGTFMVSTDTQVFGAATQPAVVVPAVITVHTPHCAPDLNGDGFVLDDDFSIFAAAFDVFDCADAAMPAGCPADLNHDGFVDDADFGLFVPAYNGLLCIEFRG